MSPRAQLSGGLSADDPLRVEYEHGKEERTSLFRRLRVVPLQRPFHGSTMGQWPTNFQPQSRGSPMNANIVPKNWSTSTPRSTSSQHFQEEEQQPAQLETTIRESTVELPLSKPDVRRPSAIQSNAPSDGSEIPKELDVRGQPVLQKAHAEMMEKPEDHEAGPSRSNPTYLQATSRSNNGKTAVLQWMDGINNNPSERVEHRAPVVFESERPIQDEAVLNVLEHNKAAIAQKTATILDAWSTESQSRRASCTTKRESVMTTATTTRESIFSKFSSSTDQTSLTSPRVSIVLDANNRSRQGHSRDSSRLSKMTMSNRTSLMSQRSLPLRSRLPNFNEDDGAQIPSNSKRISSQDTSLSSSSLDPHAPQDPAETSVLRQDQSAPWNQVEKRDVDELNTITFAANSAVRRRRGYDGNRPSEFAEERPPNPDLFDAQLRESKQNVGKDDARKERTISKHTASRPPSPAGSEEDQFSARPLAWLDSDSSASPNEHELDDSSSGITDYSDTSLQNLSDAAGFAPMLQLLLANIRNDVVRRVTNQLYGTTHNSGGSEPNQSSSNQPSNRKSQAVNPPSQPSTNGKRSAGRRPDSPDDRDGGEPEKRRKLNLPPNPVPGPRFACPFYKHNPQNHQKWRACRGPGWPNVHRVKEHIYRRHSLPIRCHRCQHPFDGERALIEHSQADVPCAKRTEPCETIEGCSKEQEGQLRCRKKRPGQSEEDKWTQMYRVLFGKDAEVPRPYCDIQPDPDHFAKLEDCLLQILPEKLPQDINDGLMRIKQPLDDDQRERLPEIIRHALEEAIPDCLSRFFSSMPSSMPRTEVHPSYHADSGYVSVEPEPSEVGQSSALQYTPNYSVSNTDKAVPFAGTKANQIAGYTPSHTSRVSNSLDYSNGTASVVNVTECYQDFSTLLYPLEPWQALPSEITGGTEFASTLPPLQEITSTERSSQQGGMSQSRNPQAGSSISVPSILINSTEQIGENAAPWDQFVFFDYSPAGRGAGNGEAGVGRVNESWDVPGQMS